MSWSKDKDGGGGPWGSGANPGPDMEDLVREGQKRFQQIMPGGSSRGLIVLAILALIGLGAWTSYYTVPSDSVAVVQRFGQYLKDVPPGLHFKLPLGIDAATIVSRQTAIEAGIRVHHTGRRRPIPKSTAPRGEAGNTDGNRRSERRTGRVGGSISYLGSGQIPVRGPGAERNAALCFRVRNAGSRRRSYRGRGDHHRPAGNRIGSADQDAGAFNQVRNGDQHRPGAIEEHQSAPTSAGNPSTRSTRPSRKRRS